MNKAKATFHYGLIQSSYWLSYLPIFAYGTAYLLNAGYTNVQIGTLFAAANLTSILIQSPLARGVDRQKIGMKSLMLLLSGMVLLMAALIFLFSPLAIFYFIMLLSIMVLQPFVNSLGVQSGDKLDFGISRGMASFTYSLGSLLLGRLIVYFNITMLPLAAIALVLFHLLLILSFPFPKIDMEETTNVGLMGMLRLYPSLGYFLLSVVFLFFGYSMFHNYLVHVVRNIGGDESALGMAIAISAFSEVPTMFLFTKIVRRFSPKTLLLVSSFFFLLKGILDTLAPTLIMLYANQLFNALNFGLFLPSAIFFLSSYLKKEHSSTGQAFLTSAIIAGNVLASVVGGMIMDYYSVNTLLKIIILMGSLGFLMMGKAMKGTKHEHRHS